jgi:hypothetical protein
MLEACCPEFRIRPACCASAAISAVLIWGGPERCLAAMAHCRLRARNTASWAVVVDKHDERKPTSPDQRYFGVRVNFRQRQHQV